MNKTTKTTLFAVLIVLLASACGKQNNTAATAQPSTLTQAAPTLPVFSITAVDLFKGYEANEVAMDEKLKGHQIEVSGRVDAIDKNFADNIVIQLATGNQFSPASMSMLDSEKQRAIEIKKGSKITIRCQRMSRILGGPSGGDCIFVTDNNLNKNAAP